MTAHGSETLPTFEVDKEGLRKLLADRGPAFAIFELVQNAWDEEVTRVDVRLEKSSIADFVTLTVEDDNPEGFKDLAHAYTLFAESDKKNKSDKRGRFNLGEKLVVAVCDHATITTTKGTIIFTEKGREHHPGKTKKGSRFHGTLRMSMEDFAAASAAVHRLIPPAGIVTTFNGKELATREPVRTFEAKLATVLSGSEGELRRTYRKAPVALYEVAEDEEAWLYELGIPVVATGDKWHVDIGQKVELNMNRDNVPPAYLRALRARVLEAATDLLTEDDGGTEWVTAAMFDKDISREAVEAALTARFGEMRVAYDPSDPEANKIAMAQGYTVVTSRALPKEVWKAARAFEAILPAGKVTPSDKPDSHDTLLPESKWTDGMHRVAGFSKMLAEEVLGVTIEVELVNDPKAMNFNATYGPREGGQGGMLRFNYRTLGRVWFDIDPVDERVLGLVIHELGHHDSTDHFSSMYYDALAKLGARVTALALNKPEVFEPFTSSIRSAVSA